MDPGAARATSSTAAAAPTTATRSSPRSRRSRRCAEQKVPHARCVVLIEACEESGSYDLPAYVEHLADAHRQAVAGGLPRLGLRQLRPAVAHDLAARPGRRHAHGRGADRRRALGRRDAASCRPASASLRELLSRLEDEATGEIRLPDLYVQIPPQRIEQAKAAAAGARRARSAPSSRSPGRRGRWPTTSAELVLNRTWRPPLAVTGVDGFPRRATPATCCGPIDAPSSRLRMPPTLDAPAAARALKQTLEADPPLRREGHASRAGKASSGWNAPPLAPWLEKAVDAGLAGSLRPAGGLHGRGRHDPVHGHARREVPRGRSSSSPACSGPHSNAHGPNEFLHIPTGKRVTMATARLIAAHYERAK